MEFQYNGGEKYAYVFFSEMKLSLYWFFECVSEIII